MLLGQQRPLPVGLADHQGGMKAPSLLPNAADPLQQPGFKELLRLSKEKLLFVKISGFYRSSDNYGSVYSDLDGLVKKFAEEIDMGFSLAAYRKSKGQKRKGD
jgi:predicted TIM-barrel fold metal-dependent hydrolase